VIYIGPNTDVPNMRHLTVLFHGERASLFDRIEGQTAIVDLDDRGLKGDDRLAAKLESAKASVAKARLSKVQRGQAPRIVGVRGPGDEAALTSILGTQYVRPALAASGPAAKRPLVPCYRMEGAL